MSEQPGKPKHLQCSCCGAGTRGRQWWNRDTGYGICDRCAELEAARLTPEEMHSYYGTEGKHYKIT